MAFPILNNKRLDALIHRLEGGVTKDAVLEAVYNVLVDLIQTLDNDQDLASRPATDVKVPKN